MKSTRFWIILFAIVFIIAAAASLLIIGGAARGAVANVYKDGVCLYSIDLSAVDEGYTLEIEGVVTNVIAVERGRICVMDATCPDRVCVHQGWITNGVVPIVCLPNSLVIRIENASASGQDAVAG